MQVPTFMISSDSYLINQINLPADKTIKRIYEVPQRRRETFTN